MIRRGGRPSIPSVEVDPLGTCVVLRRLGLSAISEAIGAVTFVSLVTSSATVARRRVSSGRQTGAREQRTHFGEFTRGGGIGPAATCRAARICDSIQSINSPVI